MQDWDDVQGARLSNDRGWDWTGDWNAEQFPSITNPYNLPAIRDYERVFYCINFLWKGLQISPKSLRRRFFTCTYM